jgi:hypothetical protein
MGYPDKMTVQFQASPVLIIGLNMILVSNHGRIEATKMLISIWSDGDLQIKSKHAINNWHKEKEVGPLKLFQMLEEHQQSVHLRLLLKDIKP